MQRSPTRRRRSATSLSVAFLVAASACSDSGGSDASRFCGEVDANQEALTRPDLRTSADVVALLELYREIGDLAPVAIETEWRQLITNYETASTVVPGDDASRQEAVTVALQSEQSAARVKNWLIENCAVDIGPVATLVPQN